MGIPTLIKTQTASNSASLDFVDGTSDVVLDSTYDEYMFVFTDIGPATDNVAFHFQVNATDDAGGGYDTSQIQSTAISAYQNEDGDETSLAYSTSNDQANGTAFQTLTGSIGNDADSSLAGTLHLFSPSSTTYVKHFYARVHSSGSAGAETYAQSDFIAGYINDTTAIDEIQFKMSSGNFDGVIQLYGIA